MKNLAAQSYFFLIALVAFLSLVQSAVAQFTFTTNSGAITITSYTGSGPSVIIPPTLNGFPVTTIGNTAFGGDLNLTSITIPNSVTNIGNLAFSSSGLISATIPASVIGIGQEAFVSCESLTNITVTAGNPAYSSVNGVLFNRAQNILIQYPLALTTSAYTVPGSVNAITNYAFYGAVNLASITMPGDLGSISDDAFAYCVTLSTVYFGGNAPRVGNNVFFQTDFGSGIMVFYLPGTTGWALFDTTLGTTLASSTFWYQAIPAILRFGLNGNQFGFTISWATNAPVVVEANGNPSDPVWTPISTNALTANIGTATFTDPLMKSRLQRYYRLRAP